MRMPEQFTRSPQTRTGLLLCTGVALVVIGLLGGQLHWWSDSGLILVPSGRYLVLPGILAITLAIIRRQPPSHSSVSSRREEMRESALLTGQVGLLVALFTDWLYNPYSYFQSPSIRGEVFLLGLIALFLAKRFQERVLVALLPIALILLHVTFHDAANGEVLFSDDHATFQYRMMLLKDMFPNMPFYYPLWDGGMDARFFFATGALNIFLLFSPLWYLFPVTEVYNIAISSLAFLITPLSVLLAARLLKFSWPSASVAALISLSPTLAWYRWVFKYGTLGFATSLALMPLNFALIVRLLDRGHSIRYWEAIGTIVSITLMLFWSPSGLAFLPLGVIGLLRIRTLLKKRYIPIILVALIGLNLPWVLVFWKVSQVSSFLTQENAPDRTAKPVLKQNRLRSKIAPGSEEATFSEEKTSHVTPFSSLEPEEIRSNVRRRFRHRDGDINLRESLRLLRETFLNANPLLLFLGLPGLLFLPRSVGLLMGTMLLWTVSFGTILVPVKPQLELDRFTLMTLSLLSLPTGLALTQIWKQISVICTAGKHLLFLPVAGFVLSGPLIAAGILQNRTLEQFSFTDDAVSDITRLIRELPGRGRILFSGCVTHELNGHLAPLAPWTDKPLIASSPLHNLWWYQESIPAEFLARGDEGIDEYLNTFDVHAVFAHHPKWRRYFESRPADFQRVGDAGQFRMYERLNYQPNRFLSGSGKLIEERTDRVLFQLDSGDAVLKYRYFPFLQVPGCNLFPYKVSPTVRLVGIQGCLTGVPLTLQSVNPLTRVFLQQEE